MSIDEYIRFEQNENICKICESGKIIQMIGIPHGKIYKDKDAIIQEAREEAEKVVDKINKGDEQTIANVYGDKPNPLKK